MSEQINCSIDEFLQFFGGEFMRKCITFHQIQKFKTQYPQEATHDNSNIYDCPLENLEAYLVNQICGSLYNKYPWLKTKLNKNHQFILGNVNLIENNKYSVYEDERTYDWSLEKLCQVFSDFIVD